MVKKFINLGWLEYYYARVSSTETPSGVGGRSRASSFVKVSFFHPSIFKSPKSLITSIENIFIIDFKDRGRRHMSKIKIARWILLEILFLDF
jgi:hypothetical protein